MKPLADGDKVKICALILAGEPLPSEWQEQLFPGSHKPSEPLLLCTESPGEMGSSPLLFNIKEAAKKLSMSVSSVRRLIDTRQLRRHPDFGRVLISSRELERFVKSLE